ncbi:hypothetical protein F441_05619 [Phytophthora nicotianae CJ01A1]|uniref:HAT C-terminal dimerisation domain-containing protein n=1 Tax=Phytophthora nicotianae CJ01A1 TaxID=1317063 RepID=W2XED3_PHYNI|nr:hypothetical protein F441_05619 [Phytophthora nicotianae CJ01A1]
MATQNYTNARIASFYYTAVVDAFEETVEGLFRCRCGTLRRQGPRTGYSNLIQHVRSQHPDYADVMREADDGRGTLQAWIRQRARDVHGYTTLAPISVETLHAAMEGVTLAVEAKIKEEMPDQFGIIIDGWSHASEHFLAVFACYECAGTSHFPLLAMAPLINESDDDHGARTHLAFLSTMLERDYGKSLRNCLFVVADNCAVNRLLATLMGVPLVGCASHRLNLAVQDYLRDYEDDLIVLQTLMRKTKTLNYAAALRFKTPLRPIIRQDTRWGSTYAMVERYFRISEYLPVEDDDVAELLPSPRAIKRLRGLLVDLSRVQNVSKALQSDNITMLDARVWLDGLIDVEPSFHQYLEPRADIVHTPDFEIACTKVLAGDAAKLTRAQRLLLQPFEKQECESEEESEGESFVAQLQRKRKRAQRVQTYALLAAIPPTSNIVERFFSLARITYGHERHRIAPYTLEKILFLRVNKRLWDIHTVNECL